VNFRVSVAHEAEKILGRLDRATEKRIRARLVQLADDLFDPRLSARLTERDQPARFGHAGEPAQAEREAAGAAKPLQGAGRRRRGIDSHTSTPYSRVK